MSPTFLFATQEAIHSRNSFSRAQHLRTRSDALRARTKRVATASPLAGNMMDCNVTLDDKMVRSSFAEAKNRMTKEKLQSQTIRVAEMHLHKRTEVRKPKP